MKQLEAFSAYLKSNLRFSFKVFINYSTSLKNYELRFAFELNTLLYLENIQFLDFPKPDFLIHTVPWDVCDLMCTCRHTHSSKFMCAIYRTCKIIVFSLFVLLLHISCKDKFFIYDYIQEFKTKLIVKYFLKNMLLISFLK